SRAGRRPWSGCARERRSRSSRERKSDGGRPPRISGSRARCKASPRRVLGRARTVPVRTLPASLRCSLFAAREPDLLRGRPLMPIRRYKPTSPGRRFMSVSTFEEVTKTEPEKSLTAPLKKKGGRNVYGRITTRHQGGGHKRRYRIVDFKRRKDGVPAKVAAIEYDPNR